MNFSNCLKATDNKLMISSAAVTLASFSFLRGITRLIIQQDALLLLKSSQLRFFKIFHFSPKSTVPCKFQILTRNLSADNRSKQLLKQLLCHPHILKVTLLLMRRELQDSLAQREANCSTFHVSILRLFQAVHYHFYPDSNGII